MAVDAVLAVDVDEYRAALAQVNRSGWGLLAAYGSTWLAAGLLWFRLQPRSAAIATLFQGGVALPLGLALTWLTSTGPRPDGGSLNGLSIWLSVGQLLALPLLITFTVTERNELVPPTWAAVTAVHLAPYSWLYGTWLYVANGLAISLALVATVVISQRYEDGELFIARSACIGTGSIMWASAVVALLI